MSFPFTGSGGGQTGYVNFTVPQTTTQNPLSSAGSGYGAFTGAPVISFSGGSSAIAGGSTSIISIGVIALAIIFFIRELA